MAERYKIYEKLGAGGVGAVFRAYDGELKRWVAIKRLLSAGEASNDADTAAELRREADALASLRNPNIVTIFDVATDPEGLFMVMELLEGEDLADVVTRGPLHYDDFKELASQTLEALLAAHQRHILHRDIKPENIKVERLPGGRMQSKIIDFGLARSGLRARKQTEDQEGTVMGSIYYMAPEQLTREPVDERTDLYALGCVFYEALSGRKAFDGESVGDVIDKHINHDVIPLPVVAPHVPPWLGAWVFRLMAQKPDERPVNAQQAIEEFRAWEKLAAAPAMMPWMPAAQGGYGSPGSDTVPLQNYYQQPATEEPVYYAQPVIESEPVQEMAARTSQLSRPHHATSRPPVRSSATVRTRSAPLQHKSAPIPAEGGNNTKKFAIIGGAVVLLLALGWFFFGRRDGTVATSGGSAGGVLGGGPPPVTEQLPADRIFPPSSDDIVIHLVPNAGTTTTRKTAEGKPAPANPNEPVLEWHDLAALGNDNFLRAFKASPANAPRRVLWPTPKDGPVGAKPGRPALEFRLRDGQPAAMNLTDVATQRETFPFGRGTIRGDRGLTLAIAFQADPARLPTRILTLSNAEGASVSLRVDEKKRLTAEIRNGSSVSTITSKDADPTVPSVAILTWNASSGSTELRLRDAPAKTFRASGSNVTAPSAPLVRLQIGQVEETSGQPVAFADQFHGYLGDVILYSSALKNDQIQLLESKAIRDYYIQGPVAPTRPPTAAKK